MANPNDTERATARVTDANVHRLERIPPPPLGRAEAAEADEAETKQRQPQDRKPEPAPPQPPRGNERPAGRRTSKRSLRRPLLFALLPLALVVGGYFYVTGGAVMSTDNAYVQADMVGVSTDVSGLIGEVDVHDNQQVTKGQTLFKLDPQQFQLALDRANAQLASTGDDLRALQASYRNMQAQIDQAQKDVDFNMVNFQRQEQLIANNFTPKATYDAAKNTLQSAQQKLASLQEQLAGLAANLNGDPNAPIENHPKYKDAVAARDEAARQLDHTVVRAPFAGIVTNVPSIAPGKYLQASMTAFYLVATDYLWVDATPKETELTYVRPGQPVTVTVDTYPDAEWRGTIESISPAAAQEFSLLPAQNTSGNWVKVVQRIPMRVRLDTSDKSQPALRAGMSVEAAADTGHPRAC